MSDTELSVLERAAVYDHLREVITAHGFQSVTELLTEVLALREKIEAAHTIASETQPSSRVAMIRIMGALGFDYGDECSRSLKPACYRYTLKSPTGAPVSSRTTANRVKNPFGEAAGGYTVTEELLYTGDVIETHSEQLAGFRLHEFARALSVLRKVRGYVEDAVKADGGIDTCEIGLRVDLETVDHVLELDGGKDPFRIMADALITLACEGDSPANDFLIANGMFAGFDEPNAVSIARAALKRAGEM